MSDGEYVSEDSFSDPISEGEEAAAALNYAEEEEDTSVTSDSAFDDYMEELELVDPPPPPASPVFTLASSARLPLVHGQLLCARACANPCDHEACENMRRDPRACYFYVADRPGSSESEEYCESQEDASTLPADNLEYQQALLGLDPDPEHASAIRWYYEEHCRHRVKYAAAAAAHWAAEAEAEQARKEEVGEGSAALQVPMEEDLFDPPPKNPLATPAAATKEEEAIEVGKDE